jgi:hypothetical protein
VNLLNPTVHYRSVLLLQIPPCASIVCHFRAFYQQPPSNGLFTATASVAYQLDGTATVETATSTAVFQVGQWSTSDCKLHDAVLLAADQKHIIPNCSTSSLPAGNI